MRGGATLFLKIVIVVIGLAVFALCLIGLPMIAIDVSDGSNLAKLVVYSILIGMYLAAIPFYIALYQTLKLLGYIDRNEAFSGLSVKSLRIIKMCALSVSVVYMAIMPFLYIFAEKDDAPGVILIGMVIVFAAFVIAVFAAVLQKLLKNAIEIKTENDLTV